MPSVKATPRDIRKLCEALWVTPGRIYRNPEGLFIRKTRGSHSQRCDAAANAAIREESAMVADDGTLRLTPLGEERYPKPW